ncbi:MAG: porin, partial [Betaproteobacteria bacterium]|nr:porin [Betaproteobacteria bacterium]
MQKKIIALAIAGLASTAAFAQTNVTIYGIADVGQAWVKSSGRKTFEGDAAGDYVFKHNQATVGRLDSNSSYLGFKGAEALGNGLTAVFQFETAVNADTGGFGGGRDTYAGLAGAFGTVAAGRLTHPLREMGVRVDILPGDAGIGTVNSVTGAINGIKTGADDRASNAVAYISPTFGGGFSVTAAWVNGEDRNNNGANNWNNT